MGKEGKQNFLCFRPIQRTGDGGLRGAEAEEMERKFYGDNYVVIMG